MPSKSPKGAAPPRSRRLPSLTLGRYLLTALRAVRLQILLQAIKWKGQEVKKAAIHQNRTIALLHALLHIIPLATATTLIALNLRTTFIGSMTATGLTALQFTSKLLEVLIQASISAIVLAFVRSQVLGQRKYPFGGIIAPFQTTDISSLWSLELWGSLTSACIQGWPKVCMCLFVPGAVLLAALVGPSSAVLMIPRPVTYYNQSTVTFLNQSVLEYPQKVGLVGGQIEFEQQLNQTWSQAAYGVRGSGVGYNSTNRIADQSGIRTLQTLDNSNEASNYFSLLATVPTRLSTNLLSGLVAGSPGLAIGRASQPYVHLCCWSQEESITEINADTQYLDFGPEKPYLNGLIPLADLTSNSSKQDNDTSFATEPFREEDDSEATEPPALQRMVAHRPPPTISNHSILAVFGLSVPPYREWVTAACTIDASWVIASTNYTRSDSAINEHTLKVFSSLRDGKLIDLSPDWLIRVYESSSEQSQYASSLESFTLLPATTAMALSVFPIIGDSLDTVAIPYVSRAYTYPRNETTLSEQQYFALMKYLDEKDYRRKYASISLLTSTINWTDPASLAQVEMRSYERGYGYSSSAVTVQLSLAVLMLYVSTAMGYLIYTLITGTTASSWDSIGELVALALNSQRPESSLDNASVGINSVKTFRQPLNIRVNQHDSAEIVFADDCKGSGSAYTDVVPNEEY